MIQDSSKKVLKSLTGPTLDEILSISMVHGYDSYRNNIHNTNSPDVNGLEEFCKKLYIDWRNIFINNEDKLTEAGKKIREELINNPIFDPKNIIKQKSKTPFYNFFYRGHKKYFKDNGFVLGQLQDDISINPDDEEIAEGFFHVYGWNTNLIKPDKIEARLYLNLKSENIMKFASIAYDKCKRDKLPFYFKFGSNDLRNDTFLFYTSYNNMPKYIKIIEEIKKENPSLLDGCELISNKLAKINGYIGYGDEPLIKTESGNNYSYSSLRKEMINKIRSEINSLRDSSFSHNINNKDIFTDTNKNMNLYECLSEILFVNMKNKIKINKLAKEEVEEEKKSLILDLEKQIRRYILTGESSKFISSKKGKIRMELDMDNIIDSLSKYAPKKFDNKTCLLGYISRFMGFSNLKLNSDEQRLCSIIKEELIKGLKEEYKYPNANTKLIDLLLAKIEKAPKDLTGKALVLRAALGFKEKGTLYLFSKKGGYTFDERIIDVYRKYYGDSKIDAIINKYASIYQVDPNHIYFNDNTLTLINNKNNKLI